MALLAAMSARLLVVMIACNLVWSAHPLMAKLVLRELPPAHAAWARYASAFAAYLLLFGLLKAIPGLRPRLGAAFARPRSRADWTLILALGFLAFCYSPLTQMLGLAASRATDNSLIIAMEPLLTVLVAWVVLKERPRKGEGAALAAALVGFVLLSELTPAKAAQGLDSRSIGNLVLLASLLGEASYSSLGRLLLARHSPVAVFGSACAVGLALLTLAMGYLTGIPSEVPKMGWASVLGILWLGPFGTTASYLFWMILLQRVSIASLALTLFVQPVGGAAWAYLFLGERITALQAAGGAIILLAVLVQAVAEVRARSRWVMGSSQPQI